MSIDREQVKALTRQSTDLMGAWVRERKEVLAKQLGEPMKKQGLRSLGEDEKAKDRWENEGGLGQPIRAGEDGPLIVGTGKVNWQVQSQF